MGREVFWGFGPVLTQGFGVIGDVRGQLPSSDFGARQRTALVSGGGVFGMSNLWNPGTAQTWNMRGVAPKNMLIETWAQT